MDTIDLMSPHTHSVTSPCIAMHCQLARLNMENEVGVARWPFLSFFDLISINVGDDEMTLKCLGTLKLFEKFRLGGWLVE